MKPSTNETPSQTYKMTELGVLPEEWKVVPLDNKYIEFQNGLWKGKKEPYIKVRVLRNTNFKNDGTIDFEDVAELDVEQRNFKNREIIKDDIILERSGGGPTQPVGRVVFFEREDQFMYSFSNFTSRIRISDKLIIFPKFLFYFLLDFYNQGKTNDIQNRTTGIRNLDFSRYKQIPIPLPPLAEQQKIAAVLSAVQEAKEKTEAVIAAAKALKKSMM
ncbi:MAG: restriction endonuclease subunit S, partial [Paludibacteraceae bacterium]|nr:restriction endonuclease subunit S [Paludibacteraceae bacterium]